MVAIVSDAHVLTRPGVAKSETFVLGFGASSGTAGSRALSELRCVVVTVPPSYAETLEAQVWMKSEHVRNGCDLKTRILACVIPVIPNISSERLGWSGLRGCSV